MTNELRALAKAATPNWANIVDRWMSECVSPPVADRYLLAVSPRRILALLDELDALRADAADAFLLAATANQELRAELDALRAVRDAAAEWDAVPPNLTISYNPAWIEAGNALHAALAGVTDAS